MTDYTSIVNDLLGINDTLFAIGTSNKSIDKISIRMAFDKNWHNIAEHAAAAIEALQAEVDTLKRTDSKRCQECLYLGQPVGEQQLPKRGEWQKAKPHGVVTYSDGYAECSHCHEAIWLGWGMNFCPHCGTQNKIIDPDDYDGAKMEVQDA